VTVKNQSNPEPPTRSDYSDAESTAPCQSLVLASRRNFLVAGMTGATGLALMPVARRLIAPVSLELAEPSWIFPQPTPSPSPSRKRGFWATFLGILDLAASLFGFGGVIPAITGLIQCVSNNGQQAANSANSAFTAALTAMRSQGFALNVINRPQMAFSEIGIRLVSNLIQSLPCAQQRAELGLNGLNQSRAHHVLLPPSSDLRFHTPALKSDNLNGVTLHFDYTDARNPRDFDMKAAVSAPTTHALTTAQPAFERFGYRGQGFKAIVIPARQTESERALGHYEADYNHDRFTTSDGATFDINYSNVTNNGSGGTGQGDITFHGLIDKSASNKRMGLKRIEYAFGFGEGELPAEGRRRVRLKYVKGYAEFNP